MRLFITFCLVIFSTGIFADDVLTSKVDEKEVPSQIQTSVPDQIATPVPVNTAAPVQVTGTVAPVEQAPVPASDVKAPSPLQITITANADGTVGINWSSENRGVLYYNIFRASDKDFQKINDQSMTVTAYTDVTLTAGVEYKYRIDAVDGNGNTIISSEKKYVQAAPSIVPTNVFFDTSGITNIKLTWENKTEGIYYNVYRKHAGKEFIKINPDLIAGKEYIDNNIENATEYIYQLEAVRPDGSSERGNEMKFSSADMNMPRAPGGFKVYQDVESTLLKWNNAVKGSFEISGYNIYRSKKPRSQEFVKFVDAKKNNYDDVEVESAVKYYYHMKTVDVQGNESEKTDTLAVIPFPPPRTGLMLMPTAFRNDVKDNFGLNIDMHFSYYIGSIYGEHDVEPFGKDVDTISKIGAWLLTADIKGSVFNEYEVYPSLAVGYLYTILLKDQIGSSDSTGGGVQINPNQTEDSLITMHGFYGVLSKKLIFDTTFHGGYIFGFGDPDKGKNETEDITEDKGWWQIPGPAAFTPALSRYIEPDNYADAAYYFGVSRSLFRRMGIKVEYIVPYQVNDNFFLPDYYIINTHIDRLLNFDIGYFHFPGGFAWVGYINFRFTVFPNPYK